MTSVRVEYGSFARTENREQEVRQGVTQVVLEVVVSRKRTSSGYVVDVVRNLLRCLRGGNVHEIDSVRLVQLAAEPSSDFGYQSILCLMLNCEYISSRNNREAVESLQAFEDVVESKDTLQLEDAEKLQRAVMFVLDRFKTRVFADVKELILKKARAHNEMRSIIRRRNPRTFVGGVIDGGCEEIQVNLLVGSMGR